MARDRAPEFVWVGWCHFAPRTQWNYPTTVNAKRRCCQQTPAANASGSWITSLSSKLKLILFYLIIIKYEWWLVYSITNENVYSFNSIKFLKTTRVNDASMCIIQVWPEGGSRLFSLLPVVHCAPTESTAHLSTTAASSYRKQTGCNRKLQCGRSNKNLNFPNGKSKGVYSQIRLPAFISSHQKSKTYSLKNMVIWSNHQ